jgi:hypothetical protein
MMYFLSNDVMMPGLSQGVLRHESVLGLRQRAGEGPAKQGHHSHWTPGPGPGRGDPPLKIPPRRRARAAAAAARSRAARGGLGSTRKDPTRSRLGRTPLLGWPLGLYAPADPGHADQALADSEHHDQLEELFRDRDSDQGPAWSLPRVPRHPLPPQRRLIWLTRPRPKDPVRPGRRPAHAAPQSEPAGTPTGTPSPTEPSTGTPLRRRCGGPARAEPRIGVGPAAAVTPGPGRDARPGPGRGDHPLKITPRRRARAAAAAA